MLALLLAAVLLPKALAPRFEHREGFRDAGRWLRAHGGEGARVVGLFGTEIAWYGGAREIPMPRGSAAEVVAFARDRGARFVAISLRARGAPPDPAPERAFAALGLVPAYRAEEADAQEEDPARRRHYLRLIYDLGAGGAPRSSAR